MDCVYGCEVSLNTALMNADKFFLDLIPLWSTPLLEMGVKHQDGIKHSAVPDVYSKPFE